MKSFINKLIISICIIVPLMFAACIDDLNVEPNDPNTLPPADLNKQNILLVLSKCYSSLAVSGQNGPNGASDVDGLDGGTGQYTRALFMLDEFTTDEAKWIWADLGVVDLCTNTWGADNGNIYGTYSRLYVHIAVCNNLIKLLKTMDLTDSDYALALLETRTLRALSYYNAIDLFGNASFIDETASIYDVPVQKTRLELYTWLVDELEDIVTQFNTNYPNHTPIYGRVGVDGAEALLARLYLNSLVYTNGTVNGYEKCAQHCSAIIARHQGGGFNGSGLAKNYMYLFSGTNDVYMPGGSNKAENEILWGIPYDATYIQPYGGTMFLLAAATKNMTLADNNAEMDSKNYGTTENWGCMHATSSFSKMFDNGDIRWSMWCKDAQGFNIDNTKYSEFKDGYGVVKFTNLIAGVDGKWSAANGGIYDPSGSPAVTTRFLNTDLPLFRLADVYLMYAESNVVGGFGDAAKALQYVNYIRERAGVTSWTSADMTADNLLDERCRELYWELTRRSDLIRFGKYTGSNYLWPWKGNTANGTAIESYRTLFPIPNNVLAAQPDFVQNLGY